MCLWINDIFLLAFTNRRYWKYELKIQIAFKMYLQKWYIIDLPFVNISASSLSIHRYPLVREECIWAILPLILINLRWQNVRRYKGKYDLIPDQRALGSHGKTRSKAPGFLMTKPFNVNKSFVHQHRSSAPCSPCTTCCSCSSWCNHHSWNWHHNHWWCNYNHHRWGLLLSYDQHYDQYNHHREVITILSSYCHHVVVLAGTTTIIVIIIIILITILKG